MAPPLVFRHMAPRDIPLFATYVLSPEGQTYDGWEFDVLTGDPEDPGPFYPQNTRYQALYLNALKIDCVGWLFSTPTLIECKPNAGLSALGQINGYRTYYQEYYQIYPRSMIVCQRMTRQIENLAIKYDIQVRRVEPADEYTVERAISYVRPLIRPRTTLPQLSPFKQ